ncbi:peptidase inhibitor I78 family protein [Rhodobacter viridis]|uniref:Peptidase inhibitor I78 family protein n=1 Tax=Rhodobacter viridis TaxID=1054202 RepID=A0A318TZB4_9RHOB|nr:hypothetical protein [Rhodobacter viridis]PYF09728.1 peptidase inhibitor I78 family protein [Rhodobacter viridis]
MLTKYALLALAALSLTACGPSPEEETADEAVPVPHMTQPVFQTGVLENRSPDTCHAAQYASALGQPSSVIPTLGIADPVNVIEWRGIEPQEYNSHRVVFRLDQHGNIFNIDCG